MKICWFSSLCQHCNLELYIAMCGCHCNADFVILHYSFSLNLLTFSHVFDYFPPSHIQSYKSTLSFCITADLLKGSQGRIRSHHNPQGWSVHHPNPLCELNTVKHRRNVHINSSKKLKRQHLFSLIKMFFQHFLFCVC